MPTAIGEDVADLVVAARLGTRPERIEPGKPQQNGRLERFHRSLKDATAKPPQANARLQRRRFDLYRREYNEERPHEGIRMKRPAELFEPSPRRYPRKLLTPYELDGEHPFVDKQGYMRWRERRIFVTSALGGEQLTLVPQRDTALWAVRFGPVHLGHIDQERLDRGLSLPKKKSRTQRATVSGVSSD